MSQIGLGVFLMALCAACLWVPWRARAGVLRYQRWVRLPYGFIFKGPHSPLAWKAWQRKYDAAYAATKPPSDTLDQAAAQQKAVQPANPDTGDIFDQVAAQQKPAQQGSAGVDFKPNPQPVPYPANRARDIVDKLAALPPRPAGIDNWRFFDRAGVDWPRLGEELMGIAALGLICLVAVPLIFGAAQGMPCAQAKQGRQVRE